MYWCFTVKIYVMRKLCLILTVLYAFGANCSAQSLTPETYPTGNILSEGAWGFENGQMNGWNSWAENFDKSVANTGYASDHCLKVENKAAAGMWAQQCVLALDNSLEKGKTYTLTFKAKADVAANINTAITMKDNPWTAQGSANHSLTTGWAEYTFEQTIDMENINRIVFNLGETATSYYIDNICLVKKAGDNPNVAPTFTTNLNSPYTVGQGGTLTLSVEASGTPAPTYKWYSNTTNSNENGTLIPGETSATYSVPTETKGTYYYYCVANNAAGSATSNVATVEVTDPILVTGISLLAPNTMNVGTNAQCTVTISPDNATNKNVTWESSHPSIIDVDQNGNLTAKSTGTATITVKSVDGGQQVSKEIKVNASTSTNGTVVDGGMFYMVQDFGNATIDATWEIKYGDPSITHVVEHGSGTIVADPAGQKGNVLKYEAGNNDKTEFLVFHCTLPPGARLSDYKKLVFDYKMGPLEANYKDIKIFWSGVDWGVDPEYPTFKSGNEQGAGFPWHTAQISLDDQPIPNSNEFDIYIGGIPTFHFTVYLSNVRLGIGDYNQNDLTNTWSKVESETLYVTGSGPMPNFNGDQPWKDKNGTITKVIVSENITEIGDNAFKDLSNTVTIILKSIPDRFGSECFKSNYASDNTRILQLELRDSEKPYISKKVASEISNFPTFNKTTYFRNVTSNYSTVCLPFPISAYEVSRKSAKLYDFTSMGKATVGGEAQYTLEFKGHTGGMLAGQPYLIGSGDIVLSNDEGTKVEPSAFNLTPTQVTNSVENTDVSITMVGVFQPVVIATGYAYGFLGGTFYMNGGNMSVRPMRASFNGSQLYSAPTYGEQDAKQMPNIINFMVLEDSTTGVAPTDITEVDFNIKEVYNANGMKTDSLSKGLNIIRTSTGKVMKIMVK